MCKQPKEEHIMKKLITLLLFSSLIASAIAQTVTITFNGNNKNRKFELKLDNVSYFSNSSPNVKSSITVSDLSAGAHTIELTLLNSPGRSNNSSDDEPNYSKTFQLRQEYDMDIAVLPNGRVSFTEKRIRETRNNDNTVTPISADDFTQLLQTVRSRYYQSQRITAERSAFTNTANYFTTNQVRQLLLLISAESNRLALAKLAYVKVTDPNNFTQLYDVFNTVASRNDMNAFIRNNPNNNNSGNTTTVTVMSNYEFNQLLRDVNGRYQQFDKSTVIRNAFNIETNYFTISQIRQLLLKITSETDRLELAKLSYARTAEKANFTSLYNLFYTQSSKDELNNFITGNTNNSQYKTPMADYQFNQLLQSVNNQYNTSDKITSVRNALNNNYFTAAQLRSLLSGITYEADKLTLAKTGYLRVTDAANFGVVYDLFTSQSYKNDLNTYVRANGGTGFNSNTRIPMTDAAFSEVLQKVSNHFLPWSKTRDAKEAFENSSNFFTTYQIRQILSVIAGEDDRLTLAKIAHKNVTDPSNFLQLLDLFTTQVSRDDLTTYANTH